VLWLGPWWSRQGAGVRVRDEVERLLAADGVVLRREHLELRSTLDRLRAAGELVAVLPGVYAAAGRAADPATRLLAVARGEPDAVLTGAAAGRVTFWPEIRLTTVTAALPTGRVSPAGVRFERRAIPPELVGERDGLRFTTAALTVLDLSDLDRTEAIDIALRRRAVTLDGLHEALRLTAGRRGNQDRRAVLLDSRDEPWSHAERLGHRLLRRAGICGWRANLPVRVEGQLYYLDVAFERLRLALEIDGRVHQSDPELFESDRWRQNALVAAGWRVLRFTVRMLEEHPDEFVRRVREALRDFSDARSPSGRLGGPVASTGVRKAS
jgi:very-short-patch-repair endonuclease